MQEQKMMLDSKMIETTVNEQLRSTHWKPHQGKSVTLHIAESEHQPKMISPNDGERIIIIVDENTTATLIEHRAKGTYAVDILLKENAHLTYCASTTESVTVTRFAKIQRNATILWADYAAGENVHSTVTTWLAGEGADAQFTSAFLGKNKEHYTIKTTMLHDADKTTSNMLTRSVMMDESSGSYEGLIHIMPSAAGCDAYQKAETLLLGDHAQMHATPNLQIANEDVRCSHGVSLGRLDEEKLFYFASRGVTRAEAIALIIEGFFARVLDAMGENDAEARRHLSTRVMSDG